MKTRLFARVSLPARTYFNISLSEEATKKDIKTAVMKALRHIADAENGANIATETACNPRVYWNAKNERSVDEDQIFDLKGLEVLDLYTATVDDNDGFAKGEE